MQSLTCPTPTAIEDFNTLITSLQGKPITVDEMKNPELRDLNHIADDKQLNTAYYFWNIHNGDLAAIEQDEDFQVLYDFFSKKRSKAAYEELDPDLQYISGAVNSDSSLRHVAKNFPNAILKVRPQESGLDYALKKVGSISFLDIHISSKFLQAYDAEHLNAGIIYSLGLVKPGLDVDEEENIMYVASVAANLNKMLKNPLPTSGIKDDYEMFIKLAKHLASQDKLWDLFKDKNYRQDPVFTQFMKLRSDALIKASNRLNIPVTKLFNLTKKPVENLIDNTYNVVASPLALENLLNVEHSVIINKIKATLKTLELGRGKYSKDIFENLRTLEKATEQEILITFVQYAQQMLGTNATAESLNIYNRLVAITQSDDLDPTSQLNKLQSIENSLEYLEIIKDVKEHISKKPLFSQIFKTEDGSDLLTLMVGNLENYKKDITKIRQDLLVASILPHYKGHLVKLKREYEDEFKAKNRNLTLNELQKGAKEYAEKQLNNADNRDYINSRATTEIKQKMILGKDSVNILEKVVISPREVQDDLMRTMVGIVDKKRVGERKSLSEYALKIEQLKEEYYPNIGNPKDTFNKFFDRNSKGEYQGYLVSEYRSEDYITYKKLFFEFKRAIRNNSGIAEKRKALVDFLRAEIVPSKNNLYKLDTILKAKDDVLITLLGEFNFTFKTLNPAYAKLSAREKEFLGKLYELLKEDAKIVNKLDTDMVKPLGNMNFYKAPAVSKHKTEQLSSIKQTMRLLKGDEDTRGTRNTITEEEDILGKKDTQGIIEEYATTTGKVFNKIPLNHRRTLLEEQQSFDIFSSLVKLRESSLTYKTRVDLSGTLLALSDIFENRKMIKTKLLATSVDKDNVVPAEAHHYTDPAYIIQKDENGKDVAYTVNVSKGYESNVYAAYQNFLEQSLYGITEIGNEYASEISSRLAGATGSLYLSLNVTAAVRNIVQGVMLSHIEIAAGNKLEKGSLKRAYKTYWKDSQQIIADVNRTTARSKTNILMNLLNAKTSFKPLNNMFSDENFMKKHFRLSSAQFIQEGSEHMLHATIMYAYLDNKVVYNKKGESAKVLDIISVKDGKLVEGEYDIPWEDYSVELLDLVRKIYGNYDKQNLALAQRHWVGSLAFMFRKWMIPGLYRRFSGLTTVWSQEHSDVADVSGSLEEGYHTTAIRFLVNLAKDAKAIGLMAAVSKAREKATGLSSDEFANIKRSFTEIMQFLAALAGSLFLLSLLDDDDETTSLTAEAKYFITTLAYFFKAAKIETSFYTFSVFTESRKLLSSPAVPITVIDSIVSALLQLTNPLERYESGDNKGRLKLERYGINLLPIVRQFDSPISEKLEYLNR